jgi:eukaryotic-like serine/threonine-protein kinase
MAEALQLGRYSVFAELASGGMATVYLGRMSGPVGFGRTVAIKRLHPHLARDPEFVSMFLDEARLAARVQHPNVVPTLDVVTTDNELFLVLEYVKGESLGGLVRASRAEGRSIPVPVVTSIAVGLLNGLHAAHEAKDEHGAPLAIVHRDVSPQNVLVGADGIARVLDFGVAKASTRLQTTRDGQIKGKIAYMAPEQIAGNATRRSDVYSAGVVLWEALALQRLFVGENEAALLKAVIMPNIQAPSAFNPDVGPELDRIVMKALSMNPEDRFATAHEMAEALDHCMRPASANQVAAWLESLAGAQLKARTALVAEIEAHSGTTGRSEVKKLVELGAAALLAAETGPHPMKSDPTALSMPGGVPVTGASLSVATLTLKGSQPKRSRTWIVALACALVAGVVGGVVVVTARSPKTAASVSAAAGPATGTPAQAVSAPASPPPQPAPAAAGGGAPGPAGAAGAGGTPAGTDVPVAGNAQPGATDVTGADASTASTSQAGAAQAVAGQNGAAGTAGKKKRPEPPPKPRPGPAAGSNSDINSLLDSH